MRRVLFICLLLCCYLFVGLVASAPARAAAAHTSTSSTYSTKTTHAASPATCLFNMNVPIIGAFPIDFCQLLTAVVGTLTLSVTQSIADIEVKDYQYIWGLPPQATYANGDIHAFWLAILGLVDGLVVLTVLLLILRAIFSGGGYWIHYADIMEVVPKTLLALFAAHFSLYFIQLFVDLTNAFSNAFTLGNPAGFSLMQLAMGDQGIVNVFIEFFGFLMGIFDLLLIVERLLGLAVVMVLTASSPLWMFAWGIPGMQRFARLCTSGFFIILGSLAAQVFTVSLTTRILFSSLLAGGSPGETLFRGLAAVGMFAFCLTIPRLFGTWMNASPDLGLTNFTVKAVSKVV